MFHKAHPLPRAIALTLAVLMMLPVAKNWQMMASTVEQLFETTVLK